MKASDLMETDFVTIGRAERAVNALKLMDSRNVDRLLVVENGVLVGVVTEFDILAKLMSAKNLEVTRLSVSSCMSGEVITGKPNDLASDLARVMLERGISSVPIVDDAKRPLGLISKRGLLSLALELKGINVAGYCRSVNARVEMFTKLRQALNTMFNVKYNTLIVVDDGRPIGLITAKDVAKFVYSVRKVGRIKRPEVVLDKAVVVDVMTKRFRVCSPTAKLADAARIMLELMVNLVPVVGKKGNLLGLVSRRDIIRALLDHGVL